MYSRKCVTYTGAELEEINIHHGWDEASYFIREKFVARENLPTNDHHGDNNHNYAFLPPVSDKT